MRTVLVGLSIATVLALPAWGQECPATPGCPDYWIVRPAVEPIAETPLREYPRALELRQEFLPLTLEATNHDRFSFSYSRTLYGFSLEVTEQELTYTRRFGDMEWGLWAREREYPAAMRSLRGVRKPDDTEVFLGVSFTLETR